LAGADAGAIANNVALWTPIRYIIFTFMNVLASGAPSSIGLHRANQSQN